MTFLSGFGIVTIVLVSVCALQIVDGVPLIYENNDFNKFEDAWDYKIQPHSEPLLDDAPRNHTLPPEGKIDTSYDSEKTDKKRGFRFSKKLGNSVRSRVSCSVCKLGVGLLQKAVLKGDSFEDIKERFVGICVGLRIQTQGVCSGIFDVFGPDLLPVLNVTKIGPVEICSLCLGETCGIVENPLHEWTVDFYSVPKPDVMDEPLPQKSAPVFKVLQISDTHLDPEYLEGSPSECEEPLCCRSYSTPAKKKRSEKLAGKWGSYGSCDVPEILLENMLKNIAEQHPDIDYIIWTGDLPPHDIWNQTKDSNLDIIRETTRLILEAFPNTPIFPAVGNHESVPAGSFAPPWMKHTDHSIAWLYEETAKHWGKWLPSTSNNTVLHGSFYSVQIRPGFRIISLNTNYCHSISWWLLVNSTDPAKELKWLVYELQEAENKGEKVHIIGHIPPGASDCMKVWSRNYYEIVERYEKTITGQFFGHTHADEFEMFYDAGDKQRPTSVAYLGPSATTYENHNPGYRIYYIDGEHNNSTWEVIDHETWTTDLNEANASPENEPKWYKLYSAREAYGMESLRPHEWDKLVNRMSGDPDLFELFYMHYYRNSTARPECDNSKCVLQILCDLKSGKSHERHQLCYDLEQMF